MSAIGHYSLWLIPAGEVAQRLAGTIERLSSEHGTPRFDPHLTLLGGLDGGEAIIAATTERLAASLNPLTLHLRGIEFGDTYYRSLYLRVEAGDPLMRARREALRLFGRNGDPSFMPHVSLLYGTLTHDARSRLRDRLDAWRGIDFEADRLRLVATGGEPAAWSIVRDCSLGSVAQPG